MRNIRLALVIAPRQYAMLVLVIAAINIILSIGRTTLNRHTITTIIIVINTPLPHWHYGIFIGSLPHNTHIVIAIAIGHCYAIHWHWLFTVIGAAILVAFIGWHYAHCIPRHTLILILHSSIRITNWWFMGRERTAPHWSCYWLAGHCHWH